MSILSSIHKYIKRTPYTKEGLKWPFSHVHTFTCMHIWGHSRTRASYTASVHTYTYMHIWTYSRTWASYGASAHAGFRLNPPSESATLAAQYVHVYVSVFICTYVSVCICTYVMIQFWVSNLGYVIIHARMHIRLLSESATCTCSIHSHAHIYTSFVCTVCPSIHSRDQRCMHQNTKTHTLQIRIFGISTHRTLFTIDEQYMHTSTRTHTCTHLHRIFVLCYTATLSYVTDHWWTGR